MAWQQVTGILSSYGFFIILFGVVVCRRPGVFPRLLKSGWFLISGGIWAIVCGLAVNFAAVMTIRQDHLFTPSGWGHHGLREMLLALGCSVLGLALFGVGFAMFGIQRNQNLTPALSKP